MLLVGDLQDRPLPVELRKHLAAQWCGLTFHEWQKTVAEPAPPRSLTLKRTFVEIFQHDLEVLVSEGSPAAERKRFRRSPDRKFENASYDAILADYAEILAQEVPLKLQRAVWFVFLGAVPSVRRLAGKVEHALVR